MVTCLLQELKEVAVQQADEHELLSPKSGASRLGTPRIRKPILLSQLSVSSDEHQATIQVTASSHSVKAELKASFPSQTVLEWHQRMLLA